MGKNVKKTDRTDFEHLHVHPWEVHVKFVDNCEMTGERKGGNS